MTILILALLFALLLGALIGFLAASLLASSRDRYVLTERGRQALEEEADYTKTEVALGGTRDPEADYITLPSRTESERFIGDAGEKKALAARAERLRRQKAEHPEAFAPVLTNPDDPDDIVL